MPSTTHALAAWERMPGSSQFHRWHLRYSVTSFRPPRDDAERPALGRTWRLL